MAFATEPVNSIRAPSGLEVPELDDAQFERWVRLLERRTGVVVPPARRTFLAANLRGRMRETGHRDLDEYYQWLCSGGTGEREWAILVDRLTVHETSFFRHKPSYELIKREVLPRVADLGPEPPQFHAWSVGCATGEEAYSLAMLLDAHFYGLAARYYVGVTATDISHRALASARAGTYKRSQMADIPEAYRRMYCNLLDDTRFQIDAGLRRRVGFAALNLLEIERAPVRALDLIYCQNVLIYFPRERRRRVLDHLAHYLRPGGLLVLGPGEVPNWSHRALERVGGPRTQAYRRRAEGAQPL